MMNSQEYRDEFAQRCRQGSIYRDRRLPLPPHGLIVKPVGPGKLYRVAPIAREALAGLHDVVKAAGGEDESTLSWAAREYWRQGRIHSWAPLYHPDDLHAVRTQPLGRYCSRAAESSEVQSAVAAFVSQFGCLVQDLPVWRRRSSLGEELSQSISPPHPDAPGREDVLWPKRWYVWMNQILKTAQAHRVRPEMPAPVAFYVWAAHMLTALRLHPGWGGCRAFFGRRLGNLRLASTTLLDVRFGENVRALTAPIRVLVFGELLDYLAFAALRGPRRLALADAREVSCANCALPFWSEDHRRRYCDFCAKPKMRDAARARRYREGLKTMQHAL
ncbi:MAG: hypothetical protein ACE149_07060 [Armatimonadota bacterium]